MIKVDVPVFLHVGDRPCVQIGAASLALDAEDFDVAADVAGVLRAAADRLEAAPDQSPTPA